MGFFDVPRYFVLGCGRSLRDKLQAFVGGLATASVTLRHLIPRLDFIVVGTLKIFLGVLF